MHRPRVDRGLWTRAGRSRFTVICVENTRIANAEIIQDEFCVSHTVAHPVHSVSGKKDINLERFYR